VFAYFYLQDGPADAKWLSPGERATIAADLESDRRNNQRGFSHSFAEVFRDPLIYAFMMMNFAVNCGTNAVSFWTPSLLKEAGLSNFGAIGWVTGTISLISAIAMLMIGRNSDRTMERKWHFAASGVAGALGLLALPMAAGSILGTAAILTVAAIGNFSVLSLYWTIPTSYLRGNGKAGGIAAASMFGAIGSGVSPSIIGWLKVETGSLYVGLAAVACILLGGVAVALVATPKRTEPVLAVPAHS
jgi:ACS family phthalate transporter-like MFS transporter